MKNQLVIIFTSIFLATVSIQAQEINIKATGNLIGFGDIDRSYITPGIGIEGLLGELWTIEANVSKTVDQDIDMFVLGSSLKFYPYEGLYGFYLGVGADYFRWKTDQIKALDSSFAGHGNKFTGGTGLKAIIGVQAPIYDVVSIGATLAGGQIFSPNDILYFNGTVSVGIMF